MNQVIQVLLHQNQLLLKVSHYDHGNNLQISQFYFYLYNHEPSVMYLTSPQYLKIPYALFL
ncbi:Uncharacterised protein [Mycobacteroides abscessus subsp. abscessus]|nr:Uncharacterised protein [Mycobacteroides abscessus subsp. abscessus]